MFLFPDNSSKKKTSTSLAHALATYKCSLTFTCPIPGFSSNNIFFNARFKKFKLIIANSFPLVSSLGLKISWDIGAHSKDLYSEK